MVLSLAFMTEEKAANFTFSKDTYKAHLTGAFGNVMKANFSLNSARK